MISHEQIEEFICQYPVYQYAFFSPEDIEFSERVRWICQNECERYDTTWACPPAVGTVEECREKCLTYKECFLFSTIASVSDVINLEETLATRGEHEEITASIEKFIRSQGTECIALCRFPENMHPCLESHGIIVSELADRYSMDFTLSPTEILWFSLIFMK